MAAAGAPTGSTMGGCAHMTRAPGSPCSKACAAASSSAASAAATWVRVRVRVRARVRARARVRDRFRVRVKVRVRVRVKVRVRDRPRGGRQRGCTGLEMLVAVGADLMVAVVVEAGRRELCKWRWRWRGPAASD